MRRAITGRYLGTVTGDRFAAVLEPGVLLQLFPEHPRVWDLTPGSFRTNGSSAWSIDRAFRRWRTVCQRSTRFSPTETRPFRPGSRRGSSDSSSQPSMMAVLLERMNLARAKLDRHALHVHGCVLRPHEIAVEDTDEGITGEVLEPRVDQQPVGLRSPGMARREPPRGFPIIDGCQAIDPSAIRSDHAQAVLEQGPIERPVKLDGQRIDRIRPRAAVTPG